MSRLQSARRLSLLAGSSLALAGLISAASLCAALVPAAAQAAVNPCGEDPAADGATADVIVCPVATYATGIQHTSNGDLDLTLQVGSNVGTGGVVTTAGPAADDLIVRLKGVSTTSSADFTTAFPVLLDVASDDGNILVDIDVTRLNSTSSVSVRANNAATTHLVRAISSGGGDVTVTRSGGAGNLQATGASSIAGIEVRSIGGGDVTVGASTNGGQYGILASVDGGGDILITGGGFATGAAGVAGVSAISTGTGNVTVGNGQGRLFGIIAQTGAGALTINGSASANNTTGIAGIQATTGTGLLTITGSGSALAAGGVGVLIDAGGDVVFTGAATGGQYGLRLLDVAAGTTSTINFTGAGSNANFGGTALLRAEGAGEVEVNILGRLGGASGANNTSFDLAGMSGAVAIDFREASIWRLGSVPVSVAGPDAGMTLTMDAGSALIASTQLDAPLFNVETVPQEIEPPTVVSFTGDNDVFVNAGAILIGGRSPSAYLGTDIAFANAFLRDRHEAELRFEGLEEFRHSGLILLGGYYLERTDRGTDGWYDDILSLPGSRWIGEGGEVVFDVALDGPAQTDCERDEGGDLTSADCLLLVGGSTEGVTYVTISEVTPGDRGAYNPEGFLLVDVTGGTSAAGHFVVGPNSLGYSPLHGGMMDKGLFAYIIAYDADAQQHRLVGIPSGNALQLPSLAHSAQSLWRTATGTWFDRQADMRGDVGGDLGGGVWLRAAGESADRDLIQATEGGGQVFEFDNTGNQTSYAVTGGLDLISASAYVVGLTAGYSHAEVEYEASPNTAILDGFTAGAYASYLQGGVYLDALVNANKGVLRWEVPGFNFLSADTILDSNLLSVGAQVEGGWRIPFQGGAFVEPLAAVSYVSTAFDGLYAAPADGSRAGVAAEFEDAKSLRAGVGGRVGLDQGHGPARWGLSVLGRVWNEMEGDNNVILRSSGPSAFVNDDFSGTFSELGLGASLHGMDGAVSGFLNLGGMFADDYQTTRASAGVRVAW